MSDPRFGPCEPWEFDPECCELPDDASQETIDRQLAVASKHLWLASGQRYGTCEITVRPCLRSCHGGYGGLPEASRVDGEWRNFCGCTEDCSCTSLCEVVLDGPVAEIVSVFVDGVEVDESAYRLDVIGGEYRLVRLDGSCWPACQTMTASCDEDGSFCVTYDKGIALDESAIVAVSALTCELVKACIPDCECRLPANVVSKTRAGVTIAFDPDQSWLRSIPEVAMWLDVVNPRKLTSSPTVFTPDLPQTRATIQASGS